MKSRRIFAALLAPALTVLLAACGAKPAPPAVSKPSSASAPSKAPAQQVNGQTKEKIRDYLHDIAHFLQGSMPPFDRIAQIDSTWVVNDTWLRVPQKDQTQYKNHYAVSLSSVEKTAKQFLNPDISLPPNAEYHLDTTVGPHPEWIPSQRLFIWDGSGIPAVGWDYPITSAVKDGDQYRVACAETYYIPSSDELSVGPHGAVFCDGRQVGTEKDGADEKTPPSFHYTTGPAELRQIGFVLQDNGSGGFYVVSKTGAQSKAEFPGDSSQPAAVSNGGGGSASSRSDGKASGVGAKKPKGSGGSSAPAAGSGTEKTASAITEEQARKIAVDYVKAAFRPGAPVMAMSTGTESYSGEACYGFELREENGDHAAMLGIFLVGSHSRNLYKMDALTGTYQKVLP